MVPRALLLAAVASVLLLPAANAQLPSDPSPTLTLTITPASATINPGSSASFDVKVTLAEEQGQGPMMCTGAAGAEIGIAFTDKPSALNGLTGTLAAQKVVLSISSQAGPVAQGFEASNSVKFNVTATPSVLGDHDHAFNFTATFNGYTGGCTPLGPAAVPSRTVTKELAIKTGPSAAGTGTTGTGTGAGTGTNTSSGTEASPGLGVSTGLPLLGLLAFAARRRLVK